MTSCDLRIAACSYEGSVFGWDCNVEKSSEQSTASSNIELKFGFHASQGSLKSVAVSKSGKYLATAGMNERVHLYNMVENKSIGELTGHTGGVNFLEFYEDNILMSASDDGTIYIWRVYDWQHVHILGGHKAAVIGFAIHPSGKLAISVGKDQTIRLWNLVQGRCSFTRKLKMMADAICWYPSGKYYLLTSGMSLQVFDTADNTCKFTITTKSRINQALFVRTSSDDSNNSGNAEAGAVNEEEDYRIVFICDNQTVNLASMTGALVKTINLSTTGIGRLRSIAISTIKSKDYLIIATSIGCVVVLDSEGLETSLSAEDLATATAAAAASDNKEEPNTTPSTPQQVEDEFIFSQALCAFHQVKAEPRLVAITAWSPSETQKHTGSKAVVTATSSSETNVSKQVKDKELVKEVKSNEEAEKKSSKKNKKSVNFDEEESPAPLPQLQGKGKGKKPRTK